MCKLNFSEVDFLREKEYCSKENQGTQKKIVHNTENKVEEDFFFLPSNSMYGVASVFSA